MKNKWFMIIIFMILFGAGCRSVNYPKKMKVEVIKNNARMQAYIKLMDQKKTTRDQDQRMIKANGKAWKALVEVMK